MSEEDAQPWLRFFPSPAEGARSVRLGFRVIRRNGEPLLLLPTERRLAGASLSLYPAQSVTAKLARSVLAGMSQLGLYPGTTVATLDVDIESAFTQFLAGDRAATNSFRFAMLAGNVRAPGRRFVFLVFDEHGEPQRIVKAGFGGEAGAHIRREAAFLREAPRELTGAPMLHGELSTGDVSALAMEYISGNTPGAGESSRVAGLLGGWLDLGRTVRCADLPAFQRLNTAAGADPGARRILATLGDATHHPAIFHGDLAPWNIRLDPGSNRLRVFDWERGELSGPPGWDWFHFTLQPAILVRRLSLDRLEEHAHRTLRSAEFLDYARRAGITAHTRQLMLAYLLYCRDVQQQADGSERIRELHARLSSN